VLYRALEGPTDIEQARTLFKAGLPEEKITSYLENWRHRFWLFDEQYPFYQVPAYEPHEKNGKKEWRFWPAIAAEHNADNAKVLFDHVEISAAGSIPLCMAARWLVACQTFSLGGGNSDFVYTKSAPSATAAVILPLGVNLHDTLLLSLIPENNQVWEEDRPIWEQEPVPLELLKKGFKRPAMGIADLYTWLARSIKFLLDENGDALSKLTFASGVEFSPESNVDPMLGYRIDEKRGKIPIQFRDRGLWRDFDSLLPDQSYLAPQVIEHAVTLTRQSSDRFPRSVMVLGQSNNKAKIEFWRMERFALPEVLAGDRFIRSEIRQLLSDAEEAQKTLWMACRSFGRDLLSRGGGKPAGEDIKGFVKQMTVNYWYWATLESRFHEILREYTLDRESEDIRCLWLKSVRDTLRAAWEQHGASVCTGDAWAIRALVRAESPVLAKLKELNNEIQKLEF
jgi:CRISPR system Cascade subunit CasA